MWQPCSSNKALLNDSRFRVLSITVTASANEEHWLILYLNNRIVLPERLNVDGDGFPNSFRHLARDEKGKQRKLNIFECCLIWNQVMCLTTNNMLKAKYNNLQLFKFYKYARPADHPLQLWVVSSSSSSHQREEAPAITFERLVWYVVNNYVFLTSTLETTFLQYEWQFCVANDECTKGKMMKHVTTILIKSNDLQLKFSFHIHFHWFIFNSHALSSPTFL